MKAAVCVCVFQGFVSFLLPCFAVDHLYLSYDEYLLSEEDTPISEGKRLCRRKCFNSRVCVCVCVITPLAVLRSGRGP